MSAMATALFGSPLALQIYLIAHARKSDIKISNFGWPVASLSSNIQQSPSEQESAKPSEHAAFTANRNNFEPRSPDLLVMPRAGKATSVSYTAVGRGLYRREVSALEEAPESQRATKSDEQGVPEAIESSGESNPTQNPFMGRKLEEIRSEPNRYALSAATASAISQSRNDPFRKTSHVLPEDPMYARSKNRSPKSSGLLAGQACHARNMGPSVGEQKDSAAFMFERKVEHVKRINQARGPDQAACSQKGLLSEVERRARRSGEKWFRLHFMLR